jgi:hypothetical protein
MSDSSNAPTPWEVDRPPWEVDRPVALIALIDVVATARTLYGGDADRVAGYPLPEHDWRFHVSWDRGKLTTGHEQASDGRVTFHGGATAEYVAEYLARERLLDP